jgi:hypothetical protein
MVPGSARWTARMHGSGSDTLWFVPLLGWVNGRGEMDEVSFDGCMGDLSEGLRPY